MEVNKVFARWKPSRWKEDHGAKMKKWQKTG